jgi:hypothetical protein
MPYWRLSLLRLNNSLFASKTASADRWSAASIYDDTP